MAFPLQNEKKDIMYCCVLVKNVVVFLVISACFSIFMYLYREKYEFLFLFAAVKFVSSIHFGSFMLRIQGQ